MDPFSTITTTTTQNDGLIGAGLAGRSRLLMSASTHVDEWIHTATYVVEVVSPTLLALGLLSNLLVLAVLCHIRMRSAINSFLLSATFAQILYM